MANLIITVIAIALVAIASLMGAYYGGSAFLEGRDEARANVYQNEAQQIQAAFALARARGANIDDINGLVTGGYLTQRPTINWTVNLVGGPGSPVSSLTAVETNGNVCAKMPNAQSGLAVCSGTIVTARL